LCTKERKESATGARESANNKYRIATGGKEKTAWIGKRERGQ